MRAEPITLDRPAEIVGEWFLPGRPESIASGRLTYDPDDGLLLETISDAPIFFGHEKIPIVLGVGVDGRRVTLRGVFERQSRFSSPGGVSSQASVDMAFVGMHATAEIALRFHELKARLSHLNSWCSTSGLDIDRAVWPLGGEIKFGAPHPVSLATYAGALFAVVFEFVGTPAKANLVDFQLGLEQQAWLLIRPRRKWHYDAFDEFLTQTRWFFSFAAGAQDRLVELRGEATIVSRTFGDSGRTYRTKEPVWILLQRPRLQSPQERTSDEMLFRAPDVQAMSATPLRRWLGLCRRLEMEPVFGPYFAALASDRMYLDVRFQLLATTAEGYHGRTHPLPKRETFQSRMASLMHGMPRHLRRGIPPSLAKELTDTRNHASHRDAKSWSRAASGARLYAITEILKLALDVAILQDLGFKQAAITELLGRNQRVVTTANRALKLLEDTTPGRTRADPDPISHAK